MASLAIRSRFIKDLFPWIGIKKNSRNGTHRNVLGKNQLNIELSSHFCVTAFVWSCGVIILYQDEKIRAHWNTF